VKVHSARKSFLVPAPRKAVLSSQLNSVVFVQPCGSSILDEDSVAHMMWVPRPKVAGPQSKVHKPGTFAAAAAGRSQAASRIAEASAKPSSFVPGLSLPLTRAPLSLAGTRWTPGERQASASLRNFNKQTERKRISTLAYAWRCFIWFLNSRQGPVIRVKFDWSHCPGHAATAENRRQGKNTYEPTKPALGGLRVQNAALEPRLSQKFAAHKLINLVPIYQFYSKPTALPKAAGFAHLVPLQSADADVFVLEKLSDIDVVKNQNLATALVWCYGFGIVLAAREDLLTFMAEPTPQNEAKFLHFSTAALEKNIWILIKDSMLEHLA